MINISKNCNSRNYIRKSIKNFYLKFVGDSKRNKEEVLMKMSEIQGAFKFYL